MTQTNDSFEKAYTRLEQILEKMNSGAVSLDESLKLYEEADALIASCNTKLNEAETKIETLIKNRSGGVALDEKEKPLAQPFQTTSRAKEENPWG